MCFPGERPAANGHLLRSGHHPRRRSNPAATPGRVATSTGAWPGGSCSRRPRPGQQRQRHAGLAQSPSQSSVFLDVSMVENCWRIQGQARSHDGRRALIGMPGAARHPQAGQARSRCLTPAWVFGFGELGIRRAEEKELPAAADHRGSSRKVRGAWLADRYRRAFCVALSWRVPGGLRPREQKAPCRSLTADRSETRVVLLQSLVSVN